MICIKFEVFVELVKVIGVSILCIMFCYVLCNLICILLFILMFNSFEVIFIFVGFGFLGFGIELIVVVEWGYDFNKVVLDVMSGIWWMFVFLGFVIVFVVFGVMLVGESFNDFVDF